MLDGLTLDQLRVLAAVADEGSFSAAARRLRRVQSAVSHAIATLEAQLGTELFDRSARVPALSERGRAVVGAARKVLADVEALREMGGVAGGRETSVGLALDALFPLRALVDLGKRFARDFPTVGLRVETETLSAVAALVRDGTCALGVVGPGADARGLERVHVTTVRLLPVVARSHPLARLRGRVPTASLRGHVQIVLGERGGASDADHAVLSPLVWRVVDLHAKRELLRAGVGWGNMPEHAVADDLARRRLVRLRTEAWGDDEHVLSLALVWRPGVRLGPAARWIAEQLPELCALAAAPARGAVARRRG